MPNSNKSECVSEMQNSFASILTVSINKQTHSVVVFAY